MDSKLKHLEFTQAVISRMASNSFLVKGWSVTLVSALLALAAKDSNHKFVIIAYFPVFMFWLLDGYFLYQERLFRKLYDSVRTAGTTDFSMDTSKLEDSRASWPCSTFSKTLIIFHGTVVLTVLIVMFWLCR